MKRKIFSKLLMGAFLIASVSSFVSCKDYDDDINRLEDQINKAALASDLEALKATVASNASAAKAAADAAEASAKKYAEQLAAANAASIGDLEALIAQVKAIADAAATKQELAEVKTIADAAATRAELTKAIADLNGAIEKVEKASATKVELNKAVEDLNAAIKKVEDAAKKAQDTADKAVTDAKKAQDTADKAVADAKKAQDTADKANTDLATEVARAKKAEEDLSKAIEKALADAKEYADKAAANALTEAKTYADKAAASALADAKTYTDTEVAKAVAKAADDLAKAVTKLETKIATDIATAKSEAIATAKSEAAADAAQKLAAALGDLGNATVEQYVNTEIGDAVDELKAELAEVLGVEDFSKIQASYASLNDAVAALDTYITGISLYDYEGYVSDYFDTAIEPLYVRQIMDREFGKNFAANYDEYFKFVKDQVLAERDSILVRVTPANAELLKDSLSLVDTQGNELSTDYYTIEDVKPLNRVMTRGQSSASGLWVVYFNTNKEKFEADVNAGLARTDKNTDKAIWNLYGQQPMAFKKAVKDKDNRNHIAFALATKAGLNQTRRVATEYVLTLDVNQGERNDNEFTVTGYRADDDGEMTKVKFGTKPVADLHNRFVSSEDGTIIPEDEDYEELAWVSVTRDDRYTAHTEVKTGTDAPSKDNGINALARSLHQASDNRQDGAIYPIQTKDSIVIEFTGKPIKGFYVEIDKDFAVESAGSELQAWGTYNYLNGNAEPTVGKYTLDKEKMAGTAKLFKGNKGTIFLTNGNGRNLKGEVVGFRVWAVNYDGTLTDPDGKAFYVQVEGDDVVIPEATAQNLTHTPEKTGAVEVLTEAGKWYPLPTDIVYSVKNALSWSQATWASGVSNPNYFKNGTDYYRYAKIYTHNSKVVTEEWDLAGTKYTRTSNGEGVFEAGHGEPTAAQRQAVLYNEAYQATPTNANAPFRVYVATSDAGKDAQELGNIALDDSKKFTHYMIEYIPEKLVDNQTYTRVLNLKALANVSYGDNHFETAQTLKFTLTKNVEGKLPTTFGLRAEAIDNGLVHAFMFPDKDTYDGTAGTDFYGSKPTATMFHLADAGKETDQLVALYNPYEVFYKAAADKYVLKFSNSDDYDNENFWAKDAAENDANNKKFIAGTPWHRVDVDAFDWRFRDGLNVSTFYMNGNEVKTFNEDVDGLGNLDVDAYTEGNLFVFSKRGKSGNKILTDNAFRDKIFAAGNQHDVEVYTLLGEGTATKAFSRTNKGAADASWNYLKGKTANYTASKTTKIIVSDDYRAANYVEVVETLPQKFTYNCWHQYANYELDKVDDYDEVENPYTGLTQWTKKPKQIKLEVVKNESLEEYIYQDNAGADKTIDLTDPDEILPIIIYKNDKLPVNQNEILDNLVTTTPFTFVPDENGVISTAAGTYTMDNGDVITLGQFYVVDAEGSKEHAYYKYVDGDGIVPQRTDVTALTRNVTEYLCYSGLDFFGHLVTIKIPFVIKPN